MAKLEILKEPNRLLQSKSRPVEDIEFGEDLSLLLSNMAETMYAYGGVGLAAPQVGDFRRIIVLDIGHLKESESGLISGRYGSALIKMVNPEIIEKSDSSISGVEGCLSVPGLEQKVERSKDIFLKYQDENGRLIKQKFSSFISTVIQHEIDHLDGITLFSRASLLKRKRYKKALDIG